MVNLKNRKIASCLVAFIIVISFLYQPIHAEASSWDDILDKLSKGYQTVTDEDNHVEMVKNGTNSNYPNVSYGKAFESFFGNPSWRYFQGSEDGNDDVIDVVEFTGTCRYQNVNVTALIQFELSTDLKTFSATYLSFNEVPQTMFMLNTLIQTVFDEYTASNSGDDWDDGSYDYSMDGTYKSDDVEVTITTNYDGTHSLRFAITDFADVNDAYGKIKDGKFIWTGTDRAGGPVSGEFYKSGKSYVLNIQSTTWRYFESGKMYSDLKLQ